MNDVPSTVMPSTFKLRDFSFGFLFRARATPVLPNWLCCRSRCRREPFNKASMTSLMRPGPSQVYKLISVQLLVKDSDRSLNISMPIYITDVYLMPSNISVICIALMPMPHPLAQGFAACSYFHNPWLLLAPLCLTKFVIARISIFLAVLKQLLLKYCKRFGLILRQMKLYRIACLFTYVHGCKKDDKLHELISCGQVYRVMTCYMLLVIVQKY